VSLIQRDTIASTLPYHHLSEENCNISETKAISFWKIPLIMHSLPSESVFATAKDAVRVYNSKNRQTFTRVAGLADCFILNNML